MRKFFVLISLIFLLLLAANLVKAQSGEIWVLEIEAAVTQPMADYFERGIQEAEAGNADAVLIILDTPGGDLGVTLEIVETIRNATLPVIVYIAPNGAQAASAGSIITAAAHASGMAPETIIGAASPIGSEGQDLDETAYRKAVEDLTATMRSLTERRGETAVTLAESMITDAEAVSAREALAAGFIDVIANDIDDLLAQLDGLTVVVDNQEIMLNTGNLRQQPYELSFIETILIAITNPVFISILLVIGVQAIFIELSNPGGWVAGFIGVLFIGLALYGLGQLPVNWLGIGLIIVAFILMGMEVAATNHGALGVTGAITLLAGLLVLFNSSDTPDFARISIPGAIAISVGTTLFFIFILTMALRAQKAQPYSGAEGMVGRTGPVRGEFVAVNEEGPYRGTVLVMGEIWQAESDEPIENGAEVIVKSMDGFKLRVRKA